MRETARALAGEEWRIRSRRVLDVLIESCGGAVGEGHVVRTPGKSIRIDYLRRAVDDLTRDETSEHAFFHRGLPVNVEAWLRALCEHDVATHVPTRWSRKRSRRRKREREERRDERRGDLRDALTFTDVVGDVVETDLTSSRLSELDVHQTVGLLTRGGRVVVVAVVVGDETRWTGFAVESNGDVDETKVPFDPEDVRSRVDPNVVESSWTFVATGFANDAESSDAESNAIIRVETYRGLSTHVSAGLEGERTTRLRAFVDEVVVPRTLDPTETRGTRDATSMTTTIVRTRSDIARLLTLSVKREHEPWVEKALRGDDDENRDERRDDDDETTGSGTSTTVGVVPTECRNAWALADGTIVEVRDKILSRVVKSKRRWNAGKKCAVCSIARHPDVFASGRESCSSATCARAFRCWSTTTHWVFRDGRKRRIELDMNAPLFTDESLAALGAAARAADVSQTSSPAA